MNETQSEPNQPATDGSPLPDLAAGTSRSAESAARATPVRAAPSERAARTLVLIVIVTTVVILGGSWAATGWLASPAFLAVPESAPWRSFVGIQGVAWVGFAWLNRDLRPRTGTEWGLAAVICALLMLPNMSREITLVDPPPNLGVTGDGLQYFLGAFLLAGMAIVACHAAHIAGVVVALAKAKREFGELRAIHQRTRRCIASLGVLLALGMMSTSWLQRAVTALDAGAYRKELFVCYALYFTVLLAVVSVPTLSRYHDAARAFVNAATPEDSPDKDARELRKVYLEALGITAGDGVQAAIALLSPILSAALAIALAETKSK